MNWIIPLSLLVIFEIIADIFSKEWSIKQTPILWILAIASYIICNSFWLIALKNGLGLGKGAMIFALASAIVAIIIGIIFYKESTNKIQLFGMFLGIISLALIFWE